MFFNVNDDGKDKGPTDFCFERSSRRGNSGMLMPGKAVHPGIFAVATIAGVWFPYDRYDRWPGPFFFKEGRKTRTCKLCREASTH